MTANELIVEMAELQDRLLAETGRIAGVARALPSGSVCLTKKLERLAAAITDVLFDNTSIEDTVRPD